LKSNVEDLKSHNLMIIGKSGSGKTEILRQTAKICHSPFIKVEAVRYTEVGYHGDDVENIIVDLFKKTKSEFQKNLKNIFWMLRSVQKPWEEFILEHLFGINYEKHSMYAYYKSNLHEGGLDNLEITLMNNEQGRIEKFKISELKNYFFKDSIEKVFEKVDVDEIVKKNIEERAIVCIDEFDKLAKDKNVFSNSRASDEGVQNDFLPLLDGTDVPITEGKKTHLYVNTRNILFVALGAFTKVKPEDLIVEIQGRFPNKVRVNALTKNDFKLILKNSKGNVIDQSITLLKTEGIHAEFSDCAIDEICEIAFNLNQREEDIGARRLISIVDTVLEDISFSAPEIYNEFYIEGKYIKLLIDKNYVLERCDKILKQEKDLRKYIA